MFHLGTAIFCIDETLLVHAFIVRLIRAKLLQTLTSPLAFFMFLTEAKFSLLDVVWIILHRMINKIPLIPENHGVVER